MTVLYKLGITPNYKAYGVIEEAMRMIYERPTWLSEIMNLYREIGARRNRDYRSIERCLRTAIKHAWNTHPEYLQELVVYPLEKAPTAGVFLSILYYNNCLRP